MYGKIYIDVVFVTNLLMDYIILRLTGMLLRCRAGWRRYLAGAVTGAFFSCVMLCLPQDLSIFAEIFLHGACALLMLRVTFRIKKGSLLAKSLIMLYLTAFLTGGFWEAVTESGITIPAFFIFAFATYMGIGALVCAADSARSMRKNIYPITLFYQGKKQSAYGFYDTGNLLDDPVSGAPVSIVKPELLETMLSSDLIDRLKHLNENPGELKSTEIIGLKPHYLSCCTIGQAEKMMLAVTLEDLCIHTPAEEVRISKPVLALAFEPSALGKEYKVLLNSRLLH